MRVASVVHPYKGIASNPSSTSFQNDHTEVEEEEKHHLWWRDRDDTAADQEDDDVVTIPLFALYLEDTTTTNSGATETAIMIPIILRLVL
jgi:hypothetical protein